MTDNPSTDDGEDIAKLFRENDDFGAQSSLWFRPLRQLLERGKPTGAMTVLAFRRAEAAAYPFGVLTHTKKNRIVFWPVFPTNMEMVAVDGKIDIIDHVTLELPSEKTHFTAYDAAGKPLRRSAADFGHRQAWRLQRFEGHGLAVWFTILVRWSVLLEQDTAVQRCIHTRTAAEAEHIKQAFTRHAAQLNVIDVPLPSGENSPEYVYCTVYLVTDPDREINLTTDIFLHGDIDSEVDGWPDGKIFEIQPMKLRYEQTQFVIATACPPGRMRREVVLGFPRHRQ